MIKPMPARTVPILIAPLLAAALLAAAMPTGPAPDLTHALESIDAGRIRSDLKFLADDLLEGRGTGQRGGHLAALYLETRFRQLGLEPAVAGDSFLQEVPLVGIETQPESRLVFTAGAERLEPRMLEEYVANTETQKETEEIAAPLVFVGYGIVAPEFDWNDFKAADVRGKVLVMLVNDPPSEDPALFGGKALTYYGRWTYKYESAARAGALGAILIHTDQSAGYGWNVVRNSWGRERPYVALGPKSPRPLAIAAWVSEPFGRTLLQKAGQNFDALREAAARRDFRPVPLDVRLESHLVTRVRTLTTWNVLGFLRGSDPKLRDQIVVYSAHYDHLGRGAAEDGDDIYNGAADNASGVATMLEVARAFTTMPKRPRRSLLFFACAAEEGGLRGSEYYVSHPVVPTRLTVADINLDVTPVWGEPRDFTFLGADRSSLRDVVQEASRLLGFKVVTDPHPEQGSFYRSDQFNFAKFGIPAFSLDPGLDYIGKPAGYGAKIWDEYEEKRYHRPKDEYDPAFDLSGSAATARIALYVGDRVAEGAAIPTWNEGDEFAATRRGDLASHDHPPAQR
ncbi:MAG TPA: M28 family peptidase [Candidatus Polarisedimenticolia bacterium]|nr:M28 family peptidase [Candidatus Polarisedimenticolia bacterium]